MNEPLIPGGYILISRKLIESEIWDKPPLYIKVWLYLLTKAQHKQYKGLKRGQLYISIPEIMEGCSWRKGYRKEKPTKDQVFQIIDWLRKPHGAVNEGGSGATMITTTKATQGMLITIDNYDFYQDSKNYESNNEPNNEKVTKATREQRQHDNINKNVKNDKNDKNKKDDDVEEPASVNAFNFYQENFGIISPYIMQDINAWIGDLNEKLVIKSMRIALENKKQWNYAKGILKDWCSKGVKSLDDVQALKKEYNQQKAYRKGQPNKSLFDQGEESKKRMEKLQDWTDTDVKQLQEKIINDPDFLY